MRHDIAAAREDWRHAYDLGWREWYVSYNLVLSSLELNDNSTAAQLAQEMVDKWPQRWESWAARGRTALDAGRNAEAIPDLHRAITIAPKPEVALLLAGALHATGRDLDARAVLENALRANPNSPELQRALAPSSP